VSFVVISRLNAKGAVTATKQLSLATIDGTVIRNDRGSFTVDQGWINGFKNLGF